MTALALSLDPPRHPVEPEALIDKFVVAKRLGVHFATVERLIRTDALPVYRIGPARTRQQLRFRWSEVEAWLQTRLEGGVPERGR